MLKYKDNTYHNFRRKITPEIKTLSWADSPLKEDRAMFKPGISM
jgi:hypothetical protein